MQNTNDIEDTKPSQQRHKQRLGILIASGGGIIATFLPWIHAPIIGSVSGTAGDGWITLMLFLPAVILSLMGNVTKSIQGAKRLVLVISAMIASLIGLYKIIDLKSSMNEGLDDNPFAEMFASAVQVGFGLYLLVAAGFVVAFLAWYLDKERN